MAKINIRESLSKRDLISDNKYDLRNTYDSLNLSNKQKARIAEALYNNKPNKYIYSLLNNKLNENMFIDEFSRYSEEYEKLDRVSTFLTAMSPNKYYYYVGNTYFDFGQDWKWTTILAKTPRGDSYQALSPRQQEDILLARSDEELERLARQILASDFCPDKKSVNEDMHDENSYKYFALMFYDFDPESGPDADRFSVSDVGQFSSKKEAEDNWRDILSKDKWAYVTEISEDEYNYHQELIKFYNEHPGYMDYEYYADKGFMQEGFSTKDYKLGDIVTWHNDRYVIIDDENEGDLLVLRPLDKFQDSDFDDISSGDSSEDVFLSKYQLAKPLTSYLNEGIDDTLNRLGGPVAFRRELMATIDAYPGIEENIEELADMMYNMYKDVISIEELESAIEYMIDDALESYPVNESKYINEDNEEIGTIEKEALKEAFDADRVKKRIAYTTEFDNGHVFHNDYFRASSAEAEEMARQKSIENPGKVFYVQYDNVMEPCSDIMWKNGKKINESKSTDLEDDIYNDNGVEEGDRFFADGKDYIWEERIAGPIHLDFDNWAVWSARESVSIFDYATEKPDGGYDVDKDAFMKAYMEAPVVYFVVDEDTGFIDWGPCDTDIEAKDFLNSKVEDWEDDTNEPLSEDYGYTHRCPKCGDDTGEKLETDSYGHKTFRCASCGYDSENESEWAMLDESVINEDMSEEDYDEFFSIVDKIGPAINAAGGDMDDINGNLSHPYEDEDRIRIAFVSTVDKKDTKKFVKTVEAEIEKALQTTRFNRVRDIYVYQLSGSDLQMRVPASLRSEFSKKFSMFEIDIRASADL